ncbi:GlxA family transcriptional regulator [Neptuniibacter sp.]|uniref:GlxA family transcriptional regulator n=1 Tax=Neptuniibacter sp. TaxID=1962643 RepID=UPI002625C0F7|nr:helix-turn-helix domain-containing protein [Neptuniibacter sp.]MCP4596256.1 helix-turn-helix domain-containing protein [Neptuniibacter sp.]
MRHDKKTFKVNILASENALFSTIFGPFDMLIQAGVFWNILVGQQPEPPFEVKITSIDGNRITGLAGAELTPHCSINDSEFYDLIIVPSEGMLINPDSPSFQQRVHYIKRMHEQGSLIASICTGAFLVAATGLLDHKTATTHWALAPQFEAAFPKVNLDTDLIIADNDSVITSGGVSADQDLTMALIENFCGQEVSLQTARCTLVDLSHRKQSTFKTFIANKVHGDQEILKCQSFIEENLNREVSTEEVCKKVALTPRTLNRRFKQATGKTLVTYIQLLRIEQAKQLLATGNASFDHIANSVGYENVSYFRRLFKKYVGLAPKEYRRSFSSADNGGRL